MPSGERSPPQAPLLKLKPPNQTQLDELRRLAKEWAPEDTKQESYARFEVGVFDVLMQEIGLERKITILALPPCHPWGNFLDRFFRQPYKRAKAKRTAHEVLGFLSSPFPPPIPQFGSGAPN